MIGLPFGILLGNYVLLPSLERRGGAGSLRKRLFFVSVVTHLVFSFEYEAEDNLGPIH